MRTIDFKDLLSLTVMHRGQTTEWPWNSHFDAKPWLDLEDWGSPRLSGVWSDGSIKGFLSTSKVSREVATVEICVLCCCWFWNQFDMVSETPYSCETIGRELYWAILCLLLCTESAWNIRGHVLILTDFKKWSFDVSFLTSICLHNYFKTEKKLNFLNKLTLQKFWLLDLLNSRQSRTSFVFGLVSLNCWLRLLDYFLKTKRLFLTSFCFYYLFNTSTRLFCTLPSFPDDVK